MSRYEVFVDSQHDSAFSKCLTKKNIKIQQIKMACQIVPRQWQTIPHQKYVQLKLHRNIINYSQFH